MIKNRQKNENFSTSQNRNFGGTFFGFSKSSKLPWDTVNIVNSVLADLIYRYKTNRILDIQKFGKTNNKIGEKILEFCKKKILNYLSFFQKILKIKKKQFKKVWKDETWNNENLSKFQKWRSEKKV